MYLDAQQILRSLRLRIIKEKFPEHVSKYFAQTQLITELSDLINEVNRLPLNDQMEVVRQWLLKQRYETTPPLPVERLWNLTKQIILDKTSLPRPRTLSRPPHQTPSPSRNIPNRQTQKIANLSYQPKTKIPKRRQTQKTPNLSHPKHRPHHSNSRSTHPPQKQRRITRTLRPITQQNQTSPVDPSLQRPSSNSSPAKLSKKQRTPSPLPTPTPPSPSPSELKDPPQENFITPNRLNPHTVLTPEENLPFTPLEDDAQFRETPMTGIPTTPPQLDLAQQKETTNTLQKALEEGFFSTSSTQLPQIEEVKIPQDNTSTFNSQDQLQELLGDIKELQDKTQNSSSSSPSFNFSSLNPLQWLSKTSPKQRILPISLLLTLLLALLFFLFHPSTPPGTITHFPLLAQKMPVEVIYQDKQIITIILQENWQKKTSLRILPDKILSLRAILQKKNIQFVRVLAPSGELLFKLNLQF